MEINKTVETPDGSVTFQGVLNADEVEFLISYAIQTLLAKGALPFSVKDDKDMATIAPGSDSVQ